MKYALSVCIGNHMISSAIFHFRKNYHPGKFFNIQGPLLLLATVAFKKGRRMATSLTSCTRVVKIWLLYNILHDNLMMCLGLVELRMTLITS